MPQTLRGKRGYQRYVKRLIRDYGEEIETVVEELYVYNSERGREGSSTTEIAEILKYILERPLNLVIF